MFHVGAREYQSGFCASRGQKYGILICLRRLSDMFDFLWPSANTPNEGNHGSKRRFCLRLNLVESINLRID